MISVCYVPDSAWSTSAYDALDRPISTSYTDTTLNVAYHYDEANSITGCTVSSAVGRLTRVVENAVTTTYCYDIRGNVIQKRQQLGTTLDTTSYSYTLADRLQTTVNPDSTATTYSRDADGRVTSIAVSPPMGAAVTAVNAIAYRPFGPVSSYTLGNGQVITRAYDANDALTDLTSPALNLHFARNAMGNITAEGAAAGANPATETYSYDPLYRLTAIADGTTAVEGLTYNPTGDRLSKTGSGLAVGAYAYTSGTHRLSSIGTAARTSDANGNTTASASAGQTWGYGYNGRNRLTVVQANGSTVGTYTYNAMGQRIQKVATSPTAITQRYAYDEQSHLIGEYTSANHRDTIWLGDIPVATADTAGTTSTIDYVTADQLGTPRAVSDATGTTIWSWPYVGNPFGEQQPTSNGYVLNLRFPGQYNDAESGINYNMYRNFDQATGRYLQSDPIGLDGGINTFVYVGNEPLDQIDLSGLASSGRWQQVPGTNTWVRIDPPHVPGQQTHAHVDTKGNVEVAVNIDGSASHGSDLTKMTRSKKVLDFLAKKGFALKCLGGIGDALLINDVIKNEEAQDCAKGDSGACSIYQWMGGAPAIPPGA